MSPPPLSPALPPLARSGLLLAVVCGHVGGVWALIQVAPSSPPVREALHMEMRLAPPDAPPAPPASGIEIPLPEDAGPPELQPVPQLELAVPMQMPDLPPPVFPAPASPPVVARKDPPPLPKPTPPKQPEVKPQAPTVSEEAPGQPIELAARTDSRSIRKTISEAQIRYRVRPRPVYPPNAAQARESGFAIVSALIDTTGRPEEVLLDFSSTYARLDTEAVRSVREALFDPYLEDGVARPARVVVWIKFVLVSGR